ncbi:NAD(P)(+)--arginine ADP-ribosyltransferase 1-like [Carassius gibelio]|uniref:NAD(P)(+)--arginine ADP-ribosyltransferase 1-like n=1 Tax=Carassius gibelio TaxID=101364 RepID=UPI0022791C95|nr:NAD(P)(+)--arginine ADP-ribosyltransferase 1-like [Carassius gibelio]XP_052409477.1 NAD(P)(+)--arginine ADP-ribosyltransferase 1-like [Carassius gibelio]
MLLIIEALLLILAALGQDHRVAAARDIYTLDMAPDSVDDQYLCCKKKMAHLVETEYLKKEINNSPEYKIAWKKGEDFVKDQINKLTKNNLIALYVYSDIHVFNLFNPDTRSGKTNYTQMIFKWYSLHFLLTEAIQILKKQQNKCYSTFRGTKAKFNECVLNKEVRFGSFASSSLDRKIARGFGNVSCFEIYTCEGADVAKYSKLPREKEVLIPPYEKFKVTAVKKKADQPDLWCETVFTLESSGTQSNLNCALFKKPNKTKMKKYVVH